jgi:hypothetical protein
LKFAPGEKKLARAKIDEQKAKNPLEDSRTRRDDSRARGFELDSGKPPGEFACANLRRRPREGRRSWREYLYWKFEVRVREVDLARSEKWSERHRFQKSIKVDLQLS